MLGATAERPRRRKPDAYLGQVCVAVDGPITLRRPVGGGPRCIFDHGLTADAIRFRRLVGDALIKSKCFTTLSVYQLLRKVLLVIITRMDMEI
jgi:hypothetical protein